MADTVAGDAVAQLAARIDLACATITLCDAYRGMLRRRWEADDRGQDMSPAARMQMIQHHYSGELRTFLVAWQRGASAIENMRAIDSAVCGYAAQFDVADAVKAAGERLLLDFMRWVTRRLPAPGQAGVPPENQPAMDAALDRLEACLDDLTAACRDAGDDYERGAVKAACQTTEAAVVAVMDCGYDLGRMQIALDWWSEAVDGPRIEVQAVGTGPAV